MFLSEVQSAWFDEWVKQRKAETWEYILNTPGVRPRFVNAKGQMILVGWMPPEPDENAELPRVGSALRPIAGGHSDPYRDQEPGLSQARFVIADEIDDFSALSPYDIIADYAKWDEDGKVILGYWGENRHLELPRFQNDRNPIIAPETCPHCGCQEEGCITRVFGPDGVTDYCECCADTPKTGWWHSRTSKRWDERRIQSSLVPGLAMVKNTSGRLENGPRSNFVPAQWWLIYGEKTIARFPGDAQGFKQVVTLANNIVGGKLEREQVLELVTGAKNLYCVPIGGAVDSTPYD